MSKPSLDAPLSSVSAPSAAEQADMPRRAILKKLGRYAAVTPPAVTLLLAATSKRAAALVSLAPTSSRQFKNTEGSADGLALLAALPGMGSAAAIDTIDGVGICLAAIKALNTRLDVLDCGLRAASL
jgi:hypothetical protein